MATPNVTISNRTVPLQEAFDLVLHQYEDLSRSRMNETIPNELPSDRLNLLGTVPVFDPSIAGNRVSDVTEAINEIGELNGWSDTDKIKLIKRKLAGPAARFVRVSLAGRNFATFREFCSVLKERFSEPTDLNTAFDRLTTVKQGNNEPILDFSERIQVMGQIALATLPDGVAAKQLIASQVLRAFINGLIGQVGYHTRLHLPAPNSLEEPCSEKLNLN